jgi:hypothetical protein
MLVLLYMQQCKMLHVERHFYSAIISHLGCQQQTVLISDIHLIRVTTEMVYSNLQNNHGNPFHPLSCGCVQLKRKESFHKSFYM